MNARLSLVIIFFSSLLITPQAFSQQQRLQSVEVSGRHLLVDGEPFLIKGVAYSPYPAGVFPTEWGLCEYCQNPFDCFYDSGGDNFACSAEVGGGPCHPWGGQPVGGYAPYPNECANLFDRADVDLDRDFQNLAAMNVNTIRTWERVTPLLLQKANEYGIKVIAGYWIGDLYTPDGQLSDLEDIINDFHGYVQAASQDPNFSAILMFAIGNENNYHYYIEEEIPPDAPMCFVVSGTPAMQERMQTWYMLVQDLACEAHAVLLEDQERPIAVVNGDIIEINSETFFTRDEDLACIDVWGINAYRGADFGDLFIEYKNKSTKPLWISEFGADALLTHSFYDENPPCPDCYDPQDVTLDEQTQAQWAVSQWEDIMAYRDITIGGTIMEYSDEYWKGNVDPDSYHWDSFVRAHNNSGLCLSYIHQEGAQPDNFFNEEWFGIMEIIDTGAGIDDMVPRLVFSSLQSEYAYSYPFICGDLNNDGGVDISDLVYLVAYMFQGGLAPQPLSLANVNGSDSDNPDISDLTYFVSYMFQSGPPLNCP